MDSFDLRITKYKNGDKALKVIKEYLDKNLAIINFHFERYAKYLSLMEGIELGLSPMESYQNVITGLPHVETQINEDEILTF